MSNNAHELSNRLLNALDNNYNVVDMRAVNEIISILENINITKELLETTRLGKHVNELRRKTSDQSLARRAKVLVKRWRDLVIPARASPYTGSNRSSAERQVHSARRLVNTPLTSPALSLTRQVLSPAVNSPRPPSRPAWGGYESDSQDVILVDDDPPAPAPPAPPPPVTAALTTPTKRPPSPPAPAHDDKKQKRDKKPKKRRGHPHPPSGEPLPPPVSTPAPWPARNGAHERRKNGCRRDNIDPYDALVNKIPAAGAKKVMTTAELLQQIQSRGAVAAGGAAGALGEAGGAPPSPHDDDVVLVEDVCPLSVSPRLRNGASSPPPPSPAPRPPLEDPRPYALCSCEEDAPEEQCPANTSPLVLPLHVKALHNVYLPGVNGTRAPTHPHQYAVRKPTDPERPDLFASVVPLYKYSDYADDYCVKNMSRVPLCVHLPWEEFAPEPLSPPPPKSPPPLRPYPIADEKVEVKMEVDEDSNSSPRSVEMKPEYESVAPEMMSLPNLEPSERLKAPILSTDEATQFDAEPRTRVEVPDEFVAEETDHRTVERTKDVIEVSLDGRTLYSLCERANQSVPYVYSQASTAPVVTLPLEPELVSEVLESSLKAVTVDPEVDELGRPPRPAGFTEWHECAMLGDLIALPYVVID